MNRIVCFTSDDPGGLWRKGDRALDLGWESPGVPVRVLEMLATGETITLTDPEGRGLVAEDADIQRQLESEYDQGVGTYHVGDSVVYTPGPSPEAFVGTILKIYRDEDVNVYRPDKVCQIKPHEEAALDPNWTDFVPFPFSIHDFDTDYSDLFECRTCGRKSSYARPIETNEVEDDHYPDRYNDWFSSQTFKCHNCGEALTEADLQN